MLKLWINISDIGANNQIKQNEYYLFIDLKSLRGDGIIEFTK